MRTPKLEALHRMIDWHNSTNNTNITRLDIDTSEIDSNSWLAGFADGDGNFSINVTNRKKRGKITSKRIQTFFRIEVRQNYHKQTLYNTNNVSYYNIINIIGLYLGVNVYSRSRIQGEKVFHSFTVVSHNMDSHQKIMKYFDRFPLYSSKYLSYKD